ncbi:hypothetical protein KA005_12085, partial [bacterium]|nr:hypothetical protein [bacterium]
DKTVVTKARSGEIVLLAPTLFIHIKTQHEKGGLGSAFLKVPSAKELKTIISWMNLKVAGRGDGLYEFLHSRKIAGWDLVKSIKDARKLENAVETTVEKEERGQPVKVPGVRTSQPISDFETSFMTFVIRPTPPAYLPDDVKGNEKLVSAAQEGKIYSVLSVWPGAAVIYGEPVPPASQWNGRYAVIIPDGGGGGSGSKVNDDRKPYKNLKELLKDVSGNEWSRVSEKLPIQRVWKEEDNGRNIEISVSIINRNNIRMNINDLDAKDVHSEAHFHIDAHLINGIIQGFHIRTRMIPTDLLGDPKVASMIDSKLANKIRSGKTLTPEEQSMLDQI